MGEIIRVEIGIVVEKVSTSVAKVFFDSKLYTTTQESMIRLADRITEDTDGAIFIDLFWFEYGMIVVHLNTSRKTERDCLSKAVADICQRIASRRIF